jgi:hypothetical protein
MKKSENRVAYSAVRRVEGNPAETIRLRMIKRTAHILLSICCGIALGACSLNAGHASPPSARILLIGNSYTFFNDGIDRQLEGLAPDAFVERVAKAGYSLEDHWNDGEAVSKIQGASWDYVVLQEQSQRPVLAPASFYNFAKAFDQVVRESGAQTVLMMTWERPDSVTIGVTSTNLAISYNQVGEKLGIKVAPVGLAFARSRIERPDLILYSNDGHPTPEGTYLAACILYGILLGVSPQGNAFTSRGVNASEASYLQRVASDTLGY